MPELGDHIVAYMNVYYNHGIYCGGDSVIHFDSDIKRWKTATIDVTTLERFADGATIEVVTYHIEYFEPAEVVRRAERHLNRHGYKIIMNNCEHFAAWCKCGIHSSRQVELVLLFLENAGRVALPVAGSKVAPAAMKLAGVVAPKITPRLLSHLARVATPRALVSPWHMAATAAQIFTENAGQRLGWSKETTQGAGTIVGLGASLAIGAVIGGPVGIASNFGMWLFGEAVAKQISGSKKGEWVKPSDRPQVAGEQQTSLTSLTPDDYLLFPSRQNSLPK
jgi:hypothetical protein